MSEVLVLRAGEAELRLAPALGGRITACTLVAVNGQRQTVLHPYPEHHVDLNHWAKGGLYPLVPYSGRIRNAQLSHAGQDWPLAPHEGSPHTLHGIAQRRPWVLEMQRSAESRLRYTHTPDAHWPWAFEATLDVVLAPQRLSVGVALRNVGDAPMPGGIGLHPYLPYQAADGLRFEAGKAWPFDADCLALTPPMGAGVPRSQHLEAQAFAAGEVTVFHAGWAGLLDVTPQGAAHERLRLEANGALNQLVIHRPAQSPYVCVEPVSHVADGFNLHARGVHGTGTRTLAPGETVQGSMAITLGTLSEAAAAA